MIGLTTLAHCRQGEARSVATPGIVCAKVASATPSKRCSHDGKTESACVPVGATGGSRSRWNSGGSAAWRVHAVGGVRGGETAYGANNPPTGAPIASPKMEPTTLVGLHASDHTGRSDIRTSGPP